jgi:threonine synthase
MFADTSENKDMLFASINSINWTRILAQTVYFFYLSSRIDKKEINVSIPSGNFGHAYAGWYAKKMGLNLNKINIATNRNNVLDIFFKNNIYRKLNTMESLAPSMDISSASNFERLVFDSMEGNGIETQKLMKQFKKEGFSIANKLYKDLCNVFESHSVADEEILEEIEFLYEMTGDIFDPHTAIGIKNIREGSAENYVCFATAHPSKFIDTIKKVIPN